MIWWVITTPETLNIQITNNKTQNLSLCSFHKSCVNKRKSNKKRITIINEIIKLRKYAYSFWFSFFADCINVKRRQLKTGKYANAIKSKVVCFIISTESVRFRVLFQLRQSDETVGHCKKPWIQGSRKASSSLLQSLKF